MSKALGILVSGRGSNMQSIIAACESGEIEAKVKIVISNNVDAPALKFAREKSINSVHLSSRTHPDVDELDLAMLELLQNEGVDLVILAGFMKKIGPQTLNHFKGRIINIHPSLLPKYGGKGMFGLHVHQAVIDNHESETGVTIHLVDNEYDQGAILAQETVKVEEIDDSESLAKKVLQVEHRLYKEIIQKIIDGSIILPK